MMCNEFIYYNCFYRIQATMAIKLVISRIYFPNLDAYVSVQVQVIVCIMNSLMVFDMFID